MVVTRKSKPGDASKDPAKPKKIKKRLPKKSTTEPSTTKLKPTKKKNVGVSKKSTAETVKLKTPKKISVKTKLTSSTDKKSKIKNRKSSVNKAIELNRGVVYLSNLPHGFYEKELKKYCSQFGFVTGVNVPRNQNGNSKGFGFVEFKHPEVAEVVADTMNNYLMFKSLIKAKIVPLEEQKPWIFLNKKDSAKLAREKRASALAARQRTLTPEEETAHKKRAEARVLRLKNKLKEKGIDYEFTVSS